MKATVGEGVSQTIATIVNEISHIKDDVLNCKRAIIEHGDETRESSKVMSENITTLQFSVGGIQKDVGQMQVDLKGIKETLSAFVVVGRFVGAFFKGILTSAILASTVLAILKYLGKI